MVRTLVRSYAKVICLWLIALIVSPLGPPQFSQAHAKESVKLIPMKFVLVQAELCSENCAEWIAAEGDITEATPAHFKKFLKTIGDRNPPVVLLSAGGNVKGAFALGRLIRARGMETSVGQTRLADCPLKDPFCAKGIAKKGASKGTVFTAGAYCFSACPFVLSAGTVRTAGRWSLVGVHEMTIHYRRLEIKYEVTYKMVNGKKKEVRKEVQRKVRKTGTANKMDKAAERQLLAYLKEMGVSADLLQPIREASPSEMRILPISDALKYKVITEMLGASDVPGLKRCEEGQKAQQPCRPALPMPAVAMPVAPVYPWDTKQLMSGAEGAKQGN